MELPKDLCEAIISTMTENDSLSKAIRMAKEMDIQHIKSLKILKQTVKDEYASQRERLLETMNLATNVVNIRDNWYGVRYVNSEGDRLLKIESLIESDLYMIQRDCRYEKELGRIDIESLIPGMQDLVSLHIYKQEVDKRAVEILQEHGIMVEGDKSGSVGGTITASYHAVLRRVQRIIGISSENDAKDYLRTHYSEVERDVLDDFNKSELVWEDEEGFKYYFDVNNVMYVFYNNNIITLYEEDFGFTKEINRMITLSQIEVIQKLYEKLCELKEENKYREKDIHDKLVNLDNEIELLNAKINKLVSMKEGIRAERDLLGKSIDVIRKELKAESNKLFKKRDVDVNG